MHLSNQAVTLVAMYYENGGYVLRLFNDNDAVHSCEVRVGDDRVTVELGAYEIVTMRYADGAFVKQNRLV